MRPRPRTDIRLLEQFVDQGDGAAELFEDAADALEWHRAASGVLGHEERSAAQVERLASVLADRRAPPSRGGAVRSLERAVEETLAGVACPVLLVLVAGRAEVRRFEPFRTMGPVLGEDVPVLVTEGFDPRGWEQGCAPVFDSLGLTADQRRRALTQRFEDGRVEVLFVERGRVRGSALAPVAAAREDGGHLPLNRKIAIIDLLAAARDAGLQDFAEIVPLAREALGMPAGRLARMARPPSRVRRIPAAAPTVDRPAVLRGGEAMPLVPRSGAVAQVPAKPAKPEERHAVESGRCVRCGKSGAGLEGPCGRPELGRVGVLELD